MAYLTQTQSDGTDVVVTATGREYWPQPTGPWEMWIMSLIGPHTTPLEPA